MQSGPTGRFLIFILGAVFLVRLLLGAAVGTPPGHTVPLASSITVQQQTASR